VRIQTANWYPAYRKAALRVPDVLPAAFAVASVATSGIHGSVHRTTTVMIVAALSALPLLGRREWPVPVFVIVVAASIGIGVWSDFRDVNQAALLIALYSVAAHRQLRDALACAAAIAVLIIAVTIGIAGWSWWYYAILVFGLFAAALGLGLYSATRRAYLAELTDRAERLERERDREVALAAAAERTRIAREMHDIVAHNLTVMVTLSEAAAASAPDSVARATEIMRAVSWTGRRALADTRRLLGVLRENTGQPGSDPLEPAPGLAELDQLIGRVRSAGLDTTLEITGTTPGLPEGVQLTVYRLIQEALTNTLKHAGPGAKACVRLRFAPGELCVEVEDDGAGTDANAASPGYGSGLLGMTERVRAYGGEVTTGPRQPSGWRVNARLDLEGV
jgi:signal transduction histidine kinase